PTFSRNTGQTAHSVPQGTNLALVRSYGPPDAIRCASVSADDVGTIVWQWTTPGTSCSVHQNYDNADTALFCIRSQFWQITKRVYGLPPTSDLEMQLHPVGAGIAHLRDRLSCTYLFPLFHQQTTVMGIST